MCGCVGACGCGCANFRTFNCLYDQRCKSWMRLRTKCQVAGQSCCTFWSEGGRALPRADSYSAADLGIRTHRINRYTRRIIIYGSGQPYACIKGRSMCMFILSRFDELNLVL